MEKSGPGRGFAGVAVVGLGYVGLPLAVLCSRRGRAVLGIDLDAGRVDSLRRGRSYVSNVSDEEVAAAVDTGGLFPQTAAGYDALHRCSVIVACVPTPLSPGGCPDHSLLMECVGKVALRLRPGQVVIIESTVGPGTITGRVLTRLAGSSLRVGEDFFLSYSPERIDPGNETYGLVETPKVVAGVTPECQFAALGFYESIGVPTVPVSSVAVAEMTKLLENTYRDVNIALVNEMSGVCRAHGIDIHEVIEAAATKPFGFQAFYPGPGVGGHCVPVDSVYYAFWARERGMPATLAEKAREINLERPRYVVSHLRQALAGRGLALKGSRILVLGVTYKKGVNDVRNSPVLEIIDLLLAESARVSFHDPFVERIRCGGREFDRTSLEEEVIAAHDCVVLAVPHRQYANLPPAALTRPLLFDLTGSVRVGRV